MADENVFEQDIQWLQDECRKYGLPIQPGKTEEKFAEWVAKIWSDTHDTEQARIDVFFEMYLKEK